MRRQVRKQICYLREMLVNPESHILYSPAAEANSPKIVKRDTGLSPDQFQDLFSRLPTLRSTFRYADIAKDALYMYLMKVRTAMPNEDIGTAFKISKTTVGRRIDGAREALRTDFVPDHVNYVPDRDELLTKSTEMCNGLYNPDGNKVVLVCDGTYIFINKSRNYKVQRDSYTDQKKRNNIKIMMVVTTNGHIIYALGPYKAGQNDAQILLELDQTTNIFDTLQNGDILLLDRRFRDCVEHFTAKGLDVKMPALLQRSSNTAQLSTADANRTRLVTALRFIVEWSYENCLQNIQHCLEFAGITPPNDRLPDLFISSKFLSRKHRIKQPIC